ncbi:cupin domain-containing protein [Hyphobacterium sp. HN65]|uniref:Cupin domain-containing protein n=1 Tax=Hyphobacterium lacteum TaxID=3116575 RepID=A0ABU7LPT6_9PROT|nr:cupin domain-containing protein [Hyphobacterium sp. HN65]MEE2525898.1 cupin domain-containing protein [Hyphobacterium sp. HN65]
MSKHPWGDNILDYVIGPSGAEDFFKNYYEQKALIVKRDEPDRYHELLTIARIDQLLASHDFNGDSVDMARADPQISREQFILSNGTADRGSIANLYQEGATLILPQLHQSELVLKNFCRALESELSCHVQTNIYLTPPNNQGFRTHYDDHDVFVLQVEGEKLWHLYDQTVDKPFRGEGFNINEHQPGELVEEFVLKAGECAYVPRGLMHDARTQGSGDSLHITVGLIVKTWADLMLEAVSEVALHHPEFRQSLPPRYARADFDRSQAEDHFKLLVSKIAKDANLDAAFDMYIDNFIRSRPPYSEDAIVKRGSTEEKGAKFKVRPYMPWRLAEDGDQLVLITAGGELTFPSTAEAGLDKVLDGEVFDISAFAEAGEEEAQKALNRLFGYGVVERVN